jgi:hypothetical protein
MQLARLEIRARRSARLPGNRLNPQAHAPIAAMPSGQISIQTSDVIMVVLSFAASYDVAVVSTTRA